ncbi:MAG: SDR family oxidoreductase [Gammaproteobacteria bacterium]
MTTPTALITGASRGIGRACAIGLAALGYRVVLTARSKSGLQAVEDEIAQLDGSGETLSFPLDVTDDSALLALIGLLHKQVGQIDVLVNNAGIDADGTLDTEQADFDRLLNTNLRAPYVLLKHVVPMMEGAANPYIFNVASRAGKVGFAHAGSYGASKFGLVGLNESLYREFASSPIRVTAICPGWVNTDMAQSPKCPLEPDDMIQVEDIFGTLEWLLSLSPQTCVKEVQIECKGSIA